MNDTEIETDVPSTEIKTTRATIILLAVVECALGFAGGYYYAVGG